MNIFNSSTHNAQKSPLITTTQKALGTTTSTERHRRVSPLSCDVSAAVRLRWSEQPLRGRLDTDVSTRAAAVVSEVAV